MNAESINESTKPQINSLQEIKLKTFSLFQQLIKADWIEIKKTDCRN